MKTTILNQPKSIIMIFTKQYLFIYIILKFMRLSIRKFEIAKLFTHNKKCIYTA